MNLWRSCLVKGMLHHGSVLGIVPKCVWKCFKKCIYLIVIFMTCLFWLEFKGEFFWFQKYCVIVSWSKKLRLDSCSATLWLFSEKLRNDSCFAVFLDELHNKIYCAAKFILFTCALENGLKDIFRTKLVFCARRKLFQTAK